MVGITILPERKRALVDNAVLQWPEYKSIKVVRAAKITGIDKNGIDRVNTIRVDAPKEACKMLVNDGWFYKHEPQVGGYLVAYEDGYVSYSPSVPFEKGYVRMGAAAAEPDRSNHAMLSREIQCIANMLLLSESPYYPTPSPNELSNMLVNAISMYGGAEPKAAATPTFDILGCHQSAVNSYQFDPAPVGPLTSESHRSPIESDLAKAEELYHLAKQHQDCVASAAFISFMQVGKPPVEKDQALENKFYNWALSHKLTHDGKPHLATIMQAYDELLLEREELLKLQIGRTLSSGELNVLIERYRQIDQEGHTPEKDDGYIGCELVKAAGCYLLESDAYPNSGQPPPLWPWPAAAWKPKNYRFDLVRAIALALAELDRVDRRARAGA